MQIQIIRDDKDLMRFMVKGTSFTFANTLRRIMLCEVPTLAIDDIVIIENSSVLHDEILALRLGLIPIKANIESYNLPEKCNCNSDLGCSLCRAILTLDFEAKDEIKTVYSGDLISDNPEVSLVSDKIPIVKLAPDQKVKLEAYARLGIGKVHAKWQPVSSCTYRYMPIIKIDEKKCNMCGECASICPRKILRRGDNEIEIKNLIDCILCNDCVKVCKADPSAIEINWDKESFIFDIESNGNFTNEKVLFKALNILEEKIVNLLKLLSEDGKNEKEESK